MDKVAIILSDTEAEPFLRAGRALNDQRFPDGIEIRVGNQALSDFDFRWMGARDEPQDSRPHMKFVYAQAPHNRRRR